MACINCGFTSGSCPGQWYLYRCTLDNTQAVLPAPGYIQTTVDDCFNGSAGTTYSHGIWDGFCTPPVAQYPISTGPYQTDVARGPVSTGGDVYLDEGFAIACKFTPTARCLPYVVMHNIYNISGTSCSGSPCKTVLEIRKNDPTTGLPLGAPKDSNILGKTTVTFPAPVTVRDGWGNLWTLVYNYAVPVNTILDQVGQDVWLCIYSEDYAPSNSLTGSGYRRIQIKASNSQLISGTNVPITTNNVAKFTEGNIWAIDNTLNSLAFCTYQSWTCNGTVVVNQIGFTNLPSTYIGGTSCFIPYANVSGNNTSIGVVFTNPDPIRTWTRTRFSFAYTRPDSTWFTGTSEVSNISPGQHEIFFDMKEPYYIGKYDRLSVSATVIQV